MDKKIVFFDIDGTLVNDEKQLPVSTLEAIHQLKHNGHLVAIATGRPPFVFKELREQLDLHSYVSLNGQVVVHNNELIYKNPMAPMDLQRLTEYSQEKAHPIIFVNDQEWSATVDYHPHMEKAMGSLKAEEQYARHAAGDLELQEKFQALLFCEPHEEAHYVRAFPGFDFVRWHDYSVDVLPSGASKAIGIKQLLDTLSIKLENVYAFGDGLNDREMLQLIPNSVAMGNASDEVKQAAKHVTESVDGDGIYHGLHRLGLL